MATLIYSSKEFSRENILSLTNDFDVKHAAIKLIDAFCLMAKSSTVKKVSTRRLTIKDGKLFTPNNEFVRFKGN